MAIANPFKSATTPSLVEQLEAKQLVLEAESFDKADEAATLTAMAAEAYKASQTAVAQEDAVDTAVRILKAANVTL